MLRLSPFGILWDSWVSLADHRNGRGGRPDWTARVAVILFPVAAGVWAAGENWSIEAFSSNLVAAGGLLAALMISMFVQVAAWRTRLDDRAFTHMVDEAPTRRAVDATAAHSLAGALAAVVATGLCLLGGMLDHNRLLSGLTLAIGVYLALALLITIHMAYVAYQSVSDPTIKDNDDRLLHGEGSSIVYVPGRDREPQSRETKAAGSV